MPNIVCMPENGVLAIKPANLTYEEAATVPYGALTALSLLKKVNLQPGQKMLDQWRQRRDRFSGGATRQVSLRSRRDRGVQHSARGVCEVAGRGSRSSITRREDFTQNGETYDAIFDILGKSSFARCKKSLKPNGIQSVCQLQDESSWCRCCGRRSVAARRSSAPCRAKRPRTLGSLKSWSRRGRSQPSSTNAIHWNRPPRRTGMLNQAAKRAMSSSRWSIVVDDESRVKKRFSISAGIMRGSAVPKCSWPRFNNTAVKVHATPFVQAPDHASPHCAAMIIKSMEE